MLKEDVEKVLIKSLDYFRSRYGSNIDLGELKRLSDSIIDELREESELEDQINHQYLISHSQLSRLMVSGEYEFKDVTGNTIVLRYEDKDEMPFQLESGKIVVSNESKYEENDKKKNEKLNQYHRKKPRGLYQSRLKCRQNNKVSFLTRYDRFDFDKSIHDIDDLIKLCSSYNWKGKVKNLFEIRDELVVEKHNQHVIDGKQKTISDYFISKNEGKYENYSE